jgi:plastocyanin
MRTSRDPARSMLATAAPKLTSRVVVARGVLTSLAVLVPVIVLLAGCGGSSSSSSSTGSTPATAASSSSTPAPASGGSAAQTLSLAADPEGQLKYDTSSLTAKAGKVTIDFANSSPVEHNVSIESSSGSVLGATPTFQGGKKTLSLNLKPGTYKFFCSVPGHRTAGMEGTLTVN